MRVYSLRALNHTHEELICETAFSFFSLVMKATLKGLFKSYGEVLDVVAHNNMRMRGQAFVSFADVEHAKKALKDVQRFPLYSKPMVRFVFHLFLSPWPQLNGWVMFLVFSKYHSRNRDRTPLLKNLSLSVSMNTRNRGRITKVRVFSPPSFAVISYH